MFRKNKKEEDIYISILKYGRDKGLEVVNQQEIHQLAIRKGYINAEENNGETARKKAILNEIFNEAFSNVREAGSSNKRLRVESYFRLIEHIELEEAREAANSARWFSMIAIGLSMAAIIVSFIMGQKQINSPVRIDETQIERIESKIPILNDQLDTLIKNQYEIIMFSKPNQNTPKMGK